MKRFFLLVLLFLIAVPARAELTAEHVAIIAMSESKESQELAHYYAKARAVPESQILLLEGKPARTLSRQTWETQTRPAIRQWLKDNKLDKKIRCFVTCWDVPLKIGRRDAHSPEIVERQKFLTQSREIRVKEIDKLIAMLESLGSGNTDTQVAKPMAADTPLTEIAGKLDAAVTTARGQILAIPDDTKRAEANKQFEQLFAAIGGRSQILRIMAMQAQKSRLSPEQAVPLQIMEAYLQGLQQGLQALSQLPPTVARDTQLLRLLQNSAGLIGSLQWIDKERESLEKNETYSSFDSELSLIHWRDYPLDQWQPNLYYFPYGMKNMEGGTVVLVSRLAAPTMELAKGLIDKAIATEKTGLTGKVYLDARGMTYSKDKADPNTYDFDTFDQSLRDLADRIKNNTKLEVVLNDKPELFQPGECPDAALYCGWYSLLKYVDAFDWNPGAVGYHLAGTEASTLRKPDATAWCNAMLADGITATLGAVYEPYLHAFPKPDEFFSLLMTGDYCLAEVYYRTKPYNSWVMTLVGDPLYNPFKNHPALDKSHLPDQLRPVEVAGK